MTTRFRHWPRPCSLAVLALATAAGFWFVVAPVSETPSTNSDDKGGADLQAYRRIVERVHNGESYYAAAAGELRSGGYPTGSVFNWRPPTYAWVLGSLPGSRWAQVLLGALAMATLMLTYTALKKEAGNWRAICGTLLLLGAFQWCVDGDAFLSQELWVAVLIALSVACYTLGRRPAGLAAGLAALFFRELALGYCLVAMVLAFSNGRKREVYLWLVGVSLWTMFQAWHFANVKSLVTPEDRLPGSWLQFGGPAFVLDTCRMNVFLRAAPAWLITIYLVLSLLGLAVRPGENGLLALLTVCGYAAAFLVVGHPFNDYWGLLYAPLLPLGIVWAPAALRDLCGRCCTMNQSFPESIGLRPLTSDF
jgi:hypothetical protein